MSRNARYLLYRQYTSGRDFVPLQHCSRRQTKSTSKLARASNASNCFLKWGGVIGHAHL